MNQLRKRLGQRSPSYEEVVEELEYNFERKEDLKSDIKKLEEDNDHLRITNFKKAESHMADKSENSKLKEVILSLNKEIEDLRDLQNVEANEDDKLTILYLKDTIKYIKEENADNELKLKTVNKSLLVRIKSILKCDECDKSFKDKAAMLSHFLSEHKENEFKCEVCEKDFEEKTAFTLHILSNHQKCISKCNACEDTFS